MNRQRKLRSVLLVHADQEFLGLASIVLSAMGNLYVHTCRSGQQALTIVGNLMPDLILLDAALPDIDGVPVLAELRKLPFNADMPLMLIKDKVSETDNRAYRTSPGVIGIVERPAEALLLAELVLQKCEEYMARTAAIPALPTKQARA